MVELICVNVGCLLSALFLREMMATLPKSTACGRNQLLKMVAWNRPLLASQSQMGARRRSVSLYVNCYTKLHPKVKPS